MHCPQEGVLRSHYVLVTISVLRTLEDDSLTLSLRWRHRLHALDGFPQYTISTLA